MLLVFRQRWLLQITVGNHWLRLFLLSSLHDLSRLLHLVDRLWGIWFRVLYFDGISLVNLKWRYRRSLLFLEGSVLVRVGQILLRA